MTIDNNTAEVCSQTGCYKPEVMLHEDLNSALGNAVEVKLNSPCYAGDDLRITLHYATSDQALAINWLTAAQTKGKKMPYLFT